MKTLSERNKTLLLEGGRVTGSMIGGYHYVEDRLYINESRELLNFCKWIDENVGGCGSANIDMLFQAFKNPKDVSLKLEVAALKKKIDEINAYIRPAAESYAAKEVANKDKINKLYASDEFAGEIINTLLCEYLSENEVKATLLRILMRDETAVELVDEFLSE